MTTVIGKRPYGKAEWFVLLVMRLLAATFLTALIGAVENWFYERFFAPELYATGSPLARGVFALAVSFPYILVGLIVLGLPIAYALARARAENVVTYALAGAAAGILWVKVAIDFATAYGIGLSAFYGCTCALLWWWLRPPS